jgi:hypothetical protein
MTLEGPRPHYMMLEVCWDGLYTLSFGLSQFHGHGSWLMCEVALSHGVPSPTFGKVVSPNIEGKVPTFERQGTINIRIICIKVGS